MLLISYLSKQVNVFFVETLVFLKWIILSLLLCFCIDMEQVIQTLTVTVTETSSQHQVLERKLTEKEKDLENKIVDLQNSLQKVVKINILIIF